MPSSVPFCECVRDVASKVGAVLLISETPERSDIFLVFFCMFLQIGFVGDGTAQATQPNQRMGSCDVTRRPMKRRHFVGTAERRINLKKKTNQGMNPPHSHALLWLPLKKKTVFFLSSFLRFAPNFDGLHFF